MARDDQADRVLSVGEADGAYRIGLADLLRERAIRRGGSGYDPAQCIPDLELERRASERNLERIDRGDVAIEIALQHRNVTEVVFLFGQRYFAIALPERGLPAMCRIFPIEKAQRAFRIGYKNSFAERCRHSLEDESLGFSHLRPPQPTSSGAARHRHATAATLRRGRAMPLVSVGCLQRQPRDAAAERHRPLETHHCRVARAAPNIARSRVRSPAARAIVPASHRTYRRVRAASD